MELPHFLKNFCLHHISGTGKIFYFTALSCSSRTGLLRCQPGLGILHGFTLAGQKLAHKFVLYFLERTNYAALDFLVSTNYAVLDFFIAAGDTLCNLFAFSKSDILISSMRCVIFLVYNSGDN